MSATRELTCVANTKSMLSFVAGLGRYDAEEQRAALALLARARVIEDARALPPPAQDLYARQMCARWMR